MAIFLDASTHLYKRIHLSVRPSVPPERVLFNEPIMRENGRKWLGKQSKCSKLVSKSSGLSQNVPKCPRMSQNVPKCPEMSDSDLLSLNGYGRVKKDSESFPLSSLPKSLELARLRKCQIHTLLFFSKWRKTYRNPLIPKIRPTRKLWILCILRLQLAVLFFFLVLNMNLV